MGLNSNNSCISTSFKQKKIDYQSKSYSKFHIILCYAEKKLQGSKIPVNSLFKKCHTDKKKIIYKFFTSKALISRDDLNIYREKDFIEKHFRISQTPFL